ncbi:MAG: glycosyltransferase, partial [Planctomycetota bacterium]
DGGAEARRDLGIGPTAPTVGILAALRPEKNHALFLAAASRVRRQFRDATFVIIGDGPERPGLERLAKELGIADAVRFLGSRDDVPAVLGAIDVLALTSDNEANPVSILEGMAVGKPVVATDVGSVGTTVVDGVTGWLVPPGDEARMADRWMDLLGEPLQARRFGDAGRLAVVENGSLQTMVNGYETLLEQLFAAKTGSLPAPDSSRTDAPRCHS